MKKILTFLAIASFLVVGNCTVTRYGMIKKVSDKNYSLEVDKQQFFGSQKYIMNCTTSAAGNLDCVKGKSDPLGYGPVTEK